MKDQIKNALERANAYEPKRDRKHGWVWEYAMFRFNWVYGVRTRNEDKAVGLLQFILATSAATWAVSSYFLTRGYSFTVVTKVLVVLASTSLLASVLCSLLGLLPARQVSPFPEDVALRFADDYESDDAAIAKFSLALMASTDDLLRSSTRKAQRTQAGMALVCLAVVLFTAALCWEIFLPLSPS